MHSSSSLVWVRHLLPQLLVSTNIRTTSAVEGTILVVVADAKLVFALVFAVIVSPRHLGCGTKIVHRPATTEGNGIS